MRLSPCPCWTCEGERLMEESGLDGHYAIMLMRSMCLCEFCGNKRCPHGTNHRNACTGSNDPGQHGSRY